MPSAMAAKKAASGAPLPLVLSPASSMVRRSVGPAVSPPATLMVTPWCSKASGSTMRAS